MCSSKLVLIGSEDNDMTTTLVCRWLDFMGHKFIRLNDEDSLLVKSVTISNKITDFILRSKNQEFKLSDIYSFWFRRGGLKIDFRHSDFYEHIRADKETKNTLKKFIYNENYRIESFLKHFLEFNSRIKILGNPTNYINNKLVHLQIAIECGIDVPTSYIFTEKKQIKEVLNNFPELIIKAISDSPHFQNGFQSTEYNTYALYSNLISNENVDSLPDVFSPSLVQENIKKELELRIFFLKNTFFPMAIFSQLDSQTSIDFRRYNYSRPNRNIPFRLEPEIEEKLLKMIGRCQLNTGSIDMILTQNGEYKFLEINPVGQFGMVSIPCNYQIEKKIAEYLTQ